MRLPALNTSLSPFTGYTRQHWEAIADHWLSQALEYASPGGALLRIPGRHAWSGPQSDALEGFARSFLLAAARIAGGGDRIGLAERYKNGLLAGTEPGGQEEWLRGVDCVPPLTGKTQPIVEAANIALALHLCRRQLWDELATAEQQQIAAWLEHHAKRKAWANNWVLFTGIIEAFLASAGIDTDGYRSDESVRWVESWHLGDGWYTDGSRRNIDYYNAWVIHPFLWGWYDMVGADRDPDAAWRWRQRLTAFGQTYPHMFGANGSPVQQGRSLTYRTATLAPLWLGEFTGTSSIEPGAVRRLASGTLRYFVDNGVGAVGPLSLGWRGQEYLPLTQRYSGPGSPYFASMGFLGLALPADHPVWTEPEAPQPGESADAVVALPGAGWLLQSTKADGIVRLLNHGSDHITAGTPDPDPLYAKLAYSSHTGPGHEAAFDEGVDNEFAILAADGTADRRLGIDTHRVEGTVAASQGRYRSGRVLSVSTVRGCLEVRCHQVADGAAEVRHGGHLIAADTVVRSGEGEDFAWVCDDTGLTSAAIGLHGYTGGRVHRYGLVSPLGDNAAVPALYGGDAEVFVSLHVLTHSDDPTTSIQQWRSKVRVEVTGSVVNLHWQEGDTLSIPLATICPP